MDSYTRVSFSSLGLHIDLQKHARMNVTEILSRIRLTALMVSWHLSICPEGRHICGVCMHLFVCMVLGSLGIMASQYSVSVHAATKPLVLIHDAMTS